MDILPCMPLRKACMNSRDVMALMYPSRWSACSSGSMEYETSTASTTSTSTAIALGFESAERGSGAAPALIEQAPTSAAVAPAASAEASPRIAMVPSNINPALCSRIEHAFLSGSVLHQLSRRDFNSKTGKSHIGHLG